jgi:serine/threonine protein kinase
MTVEKGRAYADHNSDYYYVVDEIIYQQKKTKVWKGRLWYSSNEPVIVAIKAFERGSVPFERIDTEIHNMRTLDHDNIVKSFCVLEDMYHVLLFMEYGSSLHE